MKKWICVFISLVLVGCTGLHTKSKNKASEVQANIHASSMRSDAPAAVFVTEPPVDLNGTKIEHRPAWMSKPAAITVSGAPFYAVAEELMHDSGAFVKYGEDVDVNLPIVMDYLGGSVGDALEALASATGYAYDFSDRQVSWSAFVFERFDISYVGGDYSYLIGKDGDEDSESSAERMGGVSVEVGSNKSQFSNIAGDKVSVYEEVMDTLEAIVGDVGSVIVSRAGSSVSVRTTPVRMERVREFMNSMNDALSRQVVLEIKVLKFTSRNSAVSGIDWSLIRENARGVLAFDGSTTSSLASTMFSGAPITFSGTRTGGRSDGSQVLLQMLAEQGTVSVVTEPRVITQVNRVAELEMKQLTGYIARTEVTSNESGYPSVGITQGTVQDGYTIYLLANVDSRNRIYLHVSSLLSDLLNIERKEVHESAIESPNFVENRFTQTAVLNPGETLLLNGLKQLVNSADSAGPVRSRILQTTRGGREVIEETVVLVTPTILNMGR